MTEALGLWNYWAVIALMMIGLYIVIARDNLVKKMMGLTIFQVAAIMLYVSMGKVAGGTAPILPAGDGVFDVCGVGALVHRLDSGVLPGV